MPFCAAEMATLTISEIWSPETNIIEFNAPDAALAAELNRRGCQRYLAVTTSAAHVDNHVARVVGSSPVANNNADALVLSGWSALHVWRFRQIRHARYVALRPAGAMAFCLATLGCLFQLLLGRLSWCGAHAFLASGGQKRLFVFHIRRRKPHTSARRYVPHDLGVSGLFAKLKENGTQYAVLRWFENLPLLPPGEDLDLLVADDDLAAVHNLLDAGPGLQPCDVYSVTGLPGSDYRGLPYFPPQLAAALLSNTQIHSSQARVPSPSHHFLSLAYHAIYHKGRKSGLISRTHAWRAAKNIDHDYVSVLRSLAIGSNIRAELTFEGLDEHLQAAGWRPPRDMLVRLAKNRRDLKSLLGNRDHTNEDPGLAVFLIREAAAQPTSLTNLIEEIERQGFQILKTKILSATESQAVGRTIRGGNWGRGPWAACGGLPAAAVVAYDSEPIPVSRRTQRRFPQLTNARLLCKGKLRDSFNQTLPPELHVNALHSSDNGHEAVEYIQIVMPESLDEIQTEIVRLKASFATREPVLLQLSVFRRRAKTEVIRFGNRLAVKKTFKPHQRSYCEREAWAMSHLSEVVSAIPPLLATDGESVIYPFYDDVLKFRRASGRLLPLEVAKQAIAALRQVYEAGYALIDAHPENVIVDRQHGLKLIDFEFLYQYDRLPASFEQSFDIVGCPADFPGSQPDGGAKSYAKHWQPYIGLSLHSLLHDPIWLQHAKRSVYFIISLPWRLPRRLRDAAIHIWHTLTHDRVEPLVPSTTEPAPEHSVAKRRAA